MQRPALLAALLGLLVALPAQAHHQHIAAVAKTVAIKVNRPETAPVSVASSTKGMRLIAQTPSAIPRQPNAKTAVAKSDKVVNPAPVLANSLTGPSALPLVNGSVPQGRLARLTAYWTEEDPWTAKHESSTGVKLHEGVCAVDPKLIPYGSLLQIPGMGSYVAVDTGSAVISRQAATCGHTAAERSALVVDLFFEKRQDAEAFAAHGPAFVAVSWTPGQLAAANSPRALPAIPTLPAGAVYVLAEAPTLADCRMPLAFRTPQL